MFLGKEEGRGTLPRLGARVETDWVEGSACVVDTSQSIALPSPSLQQGIAGIAPPIAAQLTDRPSSSFSTGRCPFARPPQPPLRGRKYDGFGESAEPCGVQSPHPLVFFSRSSASFGLLHPALLARSGWSIQLALFSAAQGAVLECVIELRLSLGQRPLTPCSERK